MKKIVSFLQYKFIFLLLMINAIIMLALIIGGIILAIKSEFGDVVGITVSAICFSILCLLLFVAIKFFFNKIIIENNKVIVKRHLKEINLCEITQIIMVIEKEQIRGGTYYILIDRRKPICAESMTARNSYVKFEKSEKSEIALKSFWNKEIIKLDWEQDLQPYIEKLQENNN